MYVIADALLLRDSKDGHTSALAHALERLMNSKEFCFVYDGAFTQGYYQVRCESDLRQDDRDGKSVTAAVVIEYVMLASL